MNYYLKEQILNQVKALLPSGSQLQEKIIRKNNDVEKLGVFLVSDSPSGAVPLVYMEPMVEWAESGGNVDEIAGLIASALLSPNIDLLTGEKLEDYEEQKNHIVLRLIRKAGNEEACRKLVTRDFCDLIIVPVLLLDCPQSGVGHLAVQKTFLSLWHVTADEVFELASRNMPALLPEKLETMGKCMRELGYRNSCPDEEEAEEFPMYVLTNSSGFYGAAALLYSEKIKKLAEELQSDLLIIPCSVHELILVPEGQGDVSFLRDLLRDVNGHLLAPEEILSDQIYRYKYADGTVEIAKE